MTLGIKGGFKFMSFGIILSVVFLVVWGVSLSSNSQDLTDLLLVNASVQMALFIVVACIPFLRKGRMSYVDIAWPFGVALIGAQLLLFADGDIVRRVAVGAVYLFIGLRMGIAALIMGKKTGVIFITEFPRYQYRRMILEKSGNKHIKIHMLAEILAQGIANSSVLALPGFIIATNAITSISIWEIIGISIWAVAYILESVADTQKLLFISKNANGVCNIGLWRYSRHPNYFSEWLVWTGLVVATVPSWLSLKNTEAFATWIVLGLGAMCASVMLYITLVYLTGAKPAEYYSVRKRPAYKEYQEKTSMFFPWFPRA
jgi:steroid 5-alpha reductase family enzyme